MKLKDQTLTTQFTRSVNTERHPSETEKPFSFTYQVTMNSIRNRLSKSSSITDSPHKEGSPRRSNSINSSASGRTASSSPSTPSSKRMSIECKLPNLGERTTTAYTMEEEVERQLVLQSYLVLGADREEAFERITGIASRVFDAPVAVLSLVDQGRQWFLSNRGLGDVREEPINESFCAHIVQSRHSIHIVPNATEDIRFKDHPSVVGEPHFRFYAGAPLISPEGQRLGALCIISPTARPEGLTDSEQETLQDLSVMAVNALVERRTKLQNKDRQNSVLLQQTCTDVTASLDSIQQQLTSLCADPTMRQEFTKKHLKTFFTLVEASESMGINADMCRSTLKQIAKHEQPSKAANSGTDTKSLEDLLDQIDGIMDPVVEMDKLFKNLKVIMDPLPKNVPITIAVDPSLPAKITGDDLMLFRSTMSLLTNAVSRADCESGNIHLSLTPRGNDLHFECRDSGLKVGPEDQADLFMGKDAKSSRLASFATTVSSMEGSDYGYRSEADNVSVFWFSVPFEVAELSSGKVITETMTLAAKLPSDRQAAELALCGNEPSDKVA
jgi:signal transduction histidine kinase